MSLLADNANISLIMLTLAYDAISCFFNDKKRSGATAEIICVIGKVSISRLFSAHSLILLYQCVKNAL